MNALVNDNFFITVPIPNGFLMTLSSLTGQVLSVKIKLSSRMSSWSQSQFDHQNERASHSSALSCFVTRFNQTWVDLSWRLLVLKTGQGTADNGIGPSNGPSDHGSTGHEILQRAYPFFIFFAHKITWKYGAPNEWTLNLWIYEGSAPFTIIHKRVQLRPL